MLTKGDHVMSAESRQNGSSPHPLDDFVLDPSSMRPLGEEPEFAAILEGMVADEAPRVFAVVQEYGQRVDGQIAAWGMAFSDHAEVVSVDGRLRMSLKAPESALRGFHFGTHIRARPGVVQPRRDHARRRGRGINVDNSAQPGQMKSSSPAVMSPGAASSMSAFLAASSATTGQMAE